MKTTVWTAYNMSARPLSTDDKARCIFNGDIPFQVRGGDYIQVLKGFCVERVDRVYYSIPDNSQEIHLVTDDRRNEYPTVPVS